MFNKPDFLVVGPKKTGTTWLYTQLHYVEGIKLPPFKEISFFYDADINYRIAEIKKQLKQHQQGEKISSPFLPDIEITPEIKAQIEQSMERMSAQQADKIKRNFDEAWKRGDYAWVLLFYAIRRRFDKLNLFLYSQLFSRDTNIITGDISPEYFAMSSEAVGKVKESFPNLKVVFLLRDPLDRAWSQIRMSYKKAGVTPQTFEWYMNDQRADGDYKNAISIWEKYFGAENVFYLFYDDLLQSPENFTKQFLQFLKPDAKILEVRSERVGEGQEMLLEPAFRKKLLEDNMPQYKFLAEKFGVDSWPGKWMQNVQTKS